MVEILGSSGENVNVQIYTLRHNLNRYSANM